MRRINRLVTVLLILLSAAGIALAAKFLRHEQELDNARQAKVSNLASQLQPINEKRLEWQAKDKEWQASLEEKKKGTPCILLSFDNMGSSLYETMYEMMEQYGFRATFTLRNGWIPAEDEGLITGEEMREMLHRGWEYALSIGEDPVPEEDEEDDDYWYQEEETETESETDAEALSFMARVDNSLDAISDAGLELPETLFCTGDQYEETTDTKLAGRGFKMVRVLSEDGFPVIGEQGDKIWKIDGGLYNQKDTDIEDVLDQAVQNKNSVSVSINEVLKISKEPEYDLSLMKFSSLLNYLKGLEEQGAINVVTYSEFYQYEEEQAAEYDALTKEYAAFRQEMNEDIKALDAQEAQIVEEARSTEAEEQWAWLK